MGVDIAATMTSNIPCTGILGEVIEFVPQGSSGSGEMCPQGDSCIFTAD